MQNARCRDELVGGEHGGEGGGDEGEAGDDVGHVVELSRRRWWRSRAATASSSKMLQSQLSSEQGARGESTSDLNYSGQNIPPGQGEGLAVADESQSRGKTSVLPRQTGARTTTGMAYGKNIY